MSKTIPHVRLTLGKAEIDAVTRVLRSGYIAPGKEVALLEKKIALLSGNREGVAVSSGTTALHVALLSLNIKTGDEVIFPSYVCQALLNAVNYVGAKPKIVDIDLDTLNIDPEEVLKTISSKTKAIIVPHMFGLMADMRALTKLRVPVIEDCAMALGARVGGRKAGSFGDVATFSFYATKVVTGGEGGAVTASKPGIIQRARDVREFDKKREYKVRYNYKMSDLNAAVVNAQLKQLNSFIKKRQVIAKRYTAALEDTQFVLPVSPKGYHHVFARYVMRTKNGNHLRAYLKRGGVHAGHGVVTGSHKLVRGHRRLPNSEKALKTAVSLPIYPTLTAAEQKKIISLLRSYRKQ